MNVLAFRAKYGGPFSKLIDWWTHSPGDRLKWGYISKREGFSHTEIGFSLAATLWYIKKLEKERHKKMPEVKEPEDDFLYGDLRLCFSASEQDKCVRLKLIDLKKKKWLRIKCEAGVELEKKIIGWCETQVGRGYDYVGLLGFMCRKLHIVKPSPESDWCSETTENCLYDFRFVGELLDSKRKKFSRMPPSPNALITKLQKLKQPLTPGPNNIP